MAACLRRHQLQDGLDTLRLEPDNLITLWRNGIPLPHHRPSGLVTVHVKLAQGANPSEARRGFADRTPVAEFEIIEDLFFAIGFTDEDAVDCLHGLEKLGVHLIDGNAVVDAKRQHRQQGMHAGLPFYIADCLWHQLVRGECIRDLQRVPAQRMRLRDFQLVTIRYETVNQTI